MAYKLIYIERLPISEADRLRFQERVIQMATKYGFNPNWLMATMYFETGGAFKTGYYSSSGAVGLIQFTQVAANALKVSKDYLASLNHLQQLEYVDKYFSYWKIQNRVKNLADLYLIVFAPAFFSKPTNTVIYKYPSKEYTANKSFDKDGKGYFTISDVSATIARYLPAGSEFINSTTNIVSVLVIIVIAIILKKNKGA